MELPQAIRLWTEKLLHKSEKEHVNAFTIDSFGDSEIILITFSDSLIKINEIVSEVKRSKRAICQEPISIQTTAYWQRSKKRI